MYWVPVCGRILSGLEIKLDKKTNKTGKYSYKDFHLLKVLHRIETNSQFRPLIRPLIGWKKS